MVKFITAALGLLLLAASSWGLSDDLLKFVEGFEVGLVADFGNLTACVNTSSDVLSDFDQAFSELEAAIKTKNVQDLTLALRDFGDALSELSLALGDCGEVELVQAIKNLGDYLREGPKGVLEIIAKEVVNVYLERQSLGFDFRAAIKAWDSTPRDYYTAGLYTGEISGILLKL